MLQVKKDATKRLRGVGIENKQKTKLTEAKKEKIAGQW